MGNQLLTEHINSIYNGLKMSDEAVSNYLDNWFIDLPLDGKQNVMGDFNAPEEDKYNPEYYAYQMSEYEDRLISEFYESTNKIKLNDFKKVGVYLVFFGMAMPILGGFIGVMLGTSLLHFSIGGATLVGVLAASASYIVVPPVMRMAVPEANPSIYLTLSLGVTFPFNVLAGIPLYYYMAKLVV